MLHHNSIAEKKKNNPKEMTENTQDELKMNSIHSNYEQD
jgi:hypothetical protein